MLSNPARLAELRELAILDTRAEQDYDDLAALAAIVCGSPGGAVTFVDARRPFIKSSLGLSDALRARADALAPEHCPWAATVGASDGLLVIPDTRADAGWRHTPLVSGAEHIGFYAGAVLVVGGERVGALSAFGPDPSELTDAQRAALVAVARQASAHLELRRHNRKLHELAVTDPLTGLANRRLMTVTLRRALQERQPGRDVGVIFCDVDGFKVVNDAFGHEAGDRLLGHIASELSACLRPEDFVARVGGDEFVVLCPRLPSPAALEAIADRIRAIVCLAPSDDGRPLRLSVGAAVAAHGETPDGVLRRADARMYEDKRVGQASVRRLITGGGDPRAATASLAG